MAIFHLLKIRKSIDIFKNEKCKVTFCLEYIRFVIIKSCQQHVVINFVGWLQFSTLEDKTRGPMVL